MTKASHLCNFINDHPDNWEELLVNEKRLIVKHDENYPLALFLYQELNCDFTDPVVQEARGIIIRLDTLDVVCWPFNKFFERENKLAGKLDLSAPVLIMEKMDGTLINYWWNPFANRFQFSTRGTIDASDAPLGSFDDSITITARTFGSLIFDTSVYEILRSWSGKNKYTTYMFELCSPCNKVVIPYNGVNLYSIGSRNNQTGQETGILTEFSKPRIRIAYVDSEEELNEKIVNTMEDFSKSWMCGVIEGVVVVDQNFHRWKVKTTEWYLLDSCTTATTGKRGVIDYIRTHSINDLKTLMLLGTKESAVISYYLSLWTGFVYEASRLVQFVREIEARDDYESIGRKGIAEAIKPHKYSFIGFAAIGNKKTVRELILNVRTNTICKIFPSFDQGKTMYNIRKNFYENLNPATNSDTALNRKLGEPSEIYIDKNNGRKAMIPIKKEEEI